MSLTYTEIQAITEDYFKLDGRQATDIYFNTSFFMKHFMDQKKGLFERPSGGERIRVPLEFDEGQGGFYARGGTISSDDNDVVNYHNHRRHKLNDHVIDYHDNGSK